MEDKAYSSEEEALKHDESANNIADLIKEDIELRDKELLYNIAEALGQKFKQLNRKNVTLIQKNACVYQNQWMHLVEVGGIKLLVINSYYTDIATVQYKGFFKKYPYPKKFIKRLADLEEECQSTCSDV